MLILLLACWQGHAGCSSVLELTLKVCCSPGSTYLWAFAVVAPRLWDTLALCIRHIYISFKNTHVLWGILGKTSFWSDLVSFLVTFNLCYFFNCIYYLIINSSVSFILLSYYYLIFFVWLMFDFLTFISVFTGKYFVVFKVEIKLDFFWFSATVYVYIEYWCYDVMLCSLKQQLQICSEVSHSDTWALLC